MAILDCKRLCNNDEPSALIALARVCEGKGG
jgi:hypothetical protein